MKKIVILFFLSCVSMFSTAQIAIPFRQEFINYWVQFKNALKFNDADFLFSSVQVPFVGEGSYYNPEAELDEIKDNHMLIFPPYIHEMEFVRFDAVLVEGEEAYVWLGYSPDDDAYFYSYKKMPEDEGSNAMTMSEKWWFKRVGNTFKFYRTSLEFD